MRDRRSRPCLAEEALATLVGGGPACRGLGQYLQGYLPPQTRVRGAVDDAHPAFAELGVYTKVAERSTDHEGERLSLNWRHATSA